MGPSSRDVGVTLISWLHPRYLPCLAVFPVPWATNRRWPLTWGPCRRELPPPRRAPSRPYRYIFPPLSLSLSLSLPPFLPPSLSLSHSLSSSSKAGVAVMMQSTPLMRAADERKYFVTDALMPLPLATLSLIPMLHVIQSGNEAEHITSPLRPSLSQLTI